MTGQSSLKRALLYSLIAALVLSAVFGVYVFLLGDFGKMEVRILETTLAVAYYTEWRSQRSPTRQKISPSSSASDRCC